MNQPVPTVTLREIASADLSHLMRERNDPDTRRYLEDNRVIESLAQQHAWLDALARDPDSVYARYWLATLLQSAGDLRARYLARLAERKDALTRLAAATGWHYQCHHTGAPAQAALLWAYRALEARV